MPMVPSPLAALAYGGVKVVGYAYFARAINSATKRSVSPYRFGVAKTALGLAGGLAYLFFILPSFGLRDASDLQTFLGAIPVRIAAWTVALAVFYGVRERPLVIVAAIAGGAIWSYVLDGLMWAIYKIVPGMVMPFC